MERCGGELATVNDLDDDEEDISDIDDEKQKKRRKKRSPKIMVFDDNDYELIEENNPVFRHPTSEICIYYLTSDEEDLMADFIVDDEVKDVYNVQ
ncbi:polyribonucleotide nucleotidyltransferase [Tanacetum coccineum]